jgi:hypothetical protein
LIPALAAFIQWDTFIQIFHDTSLDPTVIHVVEVRVAVFGTDADLLHELFQQGDAGFSTTGGPELEEDLFVSLDDHNQAMVARSEGFLGFQTI